MEMQPAGAVGLVLNWKPGSFRSAFLFFTSLTLMLTLTGNSWLLKVVTGRDLSLNTQSPGFTPSVYYANKVGYLISPECSVKHFITLFWKVLNRSMSTHFNRRH